MAAMKVEEEQNKALSKDMFEVTSKIEKMTSDLGSKVKMRSFEKEDTHAAVKWSLLSLDVLLKVVRAFSGFCFVAGAQCLAASLERDKCGHVQHLTKAPLLCSAKDLQKPSARVDTIEKRVFVSCWEKGWVEEAVRARIVALREEVPYLLFPFFEDPSFILLLHNTNFLQHRLKKERKSERPKQLLRPLLKRQRHLRRATLSRIIFFD